MSVLLRSSVRRSTSIQNVQTCININANLSINRRRDINLSIRVSFVMVQVLILE